MDREGEPGEGMSFIDVGEIQQALDAGAAGVAVMGGVMAAADPEAATAALIDRIKRVQTSRQPSG